MRLTVDPIVVRHARLMLVLIGAALVWSRPSLLALGGLLAFAARILAHRDSWPPGFGLANAITTGRILLIAALAWLPSSAMTVAILLLFALDGLDGWVARRRGEASAFGAALDMEADAFFVAVIAMCLWRNATVGLWIAIPAALRYAYVLTVMWIGREAETPRNRLTRSSFAVLIVCLAVAFLPYPGLAWTGALIGTLVVSASFAQSFWALRSSR